MAFAKQLVVSATSSGMSRDMELWMANELGSNRNNEMIARGTKLGESTLVSMAKSLLAAIGAPLK
jgi:hypothetical protein